MIKPIRPFKFLINGETKESPVSPDQPFKELLSYLRRTYPIGSELIASIRVGGMVIEEQDEELLSHMPLSRLGAVEVITQQNTDIARETLQMVRDYTLELEALSRAAAEGIAEGKFPREYPQLVEGIQTLADAVTSVKELLGLREIAEVTRLEHDLLNVLRAIAACHQGEQISPMAALLQEDLPANLNGWRLKGIPALIYSTSNSL